MWPARSARVRARDSSATAGSICGARPNARCSTQASRRSNASTSARRAAPTSSSPTAATASPAASRESSRVSPDQLRAVRTHPVRGRPGGDDRRRHEVHADPRGCRRSPTPASRWSGRTAPRTSRPSTRVYGDRFRWHFIGHLQSRKATVVNDLCELLPLAGVVNPRRRGSPIPALLEVNLSGEPTKSGYPPRASCRAFLELYADVRGLMTMPPATDDPEESRPHFRRLRELAESARPARAVDGNVRRTTGSPWRRERPYIRVGSTLFPRSRIPRREWRSGDLRTRTLVYFGIAEEDEFGTTTSTRRPRSFSSENYEERRANVRRLTPRRREREFDDWTDPQRRKSRRLHTATPASTTARTPPVGRPAPAERAPRRAAELQRRAADR